MEIFKNKNKVLVKQSDKTYEFRIDNEDKLQTLDNTPSFILEKLASEGYNVNIPQENHTLNLLGPYSSRPEGASELGLDITDNKYNKILNIIDAGISIELSIESDGTTKIVEIEGNKIEPITI